MKKKFSLLYNVPRLLPRESFSSWVTRLSLSQGITPSILLKYLEIHLIDDLDRHIGGLNLKQLCKKAGIREYEFNGIKKIFSSLAAFEQTGRYFLLFSGKKARYRFCPICLEQDDCPYFRIEWRFKVWHVCPLHKCFLEDQCYHCATYVTLPFNMLTSGYKNMGIGSLAICHSCGKPLSQVSPALIEDHPYLRFNPEDQLLIQNGRAFLSALYFGRYKLCGFRQKHSIVDLILHPGSKESYWESFKWNAELWRSLTID